MASDPSGRRPPDDGDPESVDKLEDVELVFFTAEPRQLRPFGSSTLKWKVQGVTQGVQVVLNNGPVSPSGQRTVRPLATHSYALAATAGSGSQAAYKALATITVPVDLSACTEVEVERTFEEMRLLLKAGVDSDPDAYWGLTDSHHLAVGVAADGRVAYQMLFRMHVENAPDLFIDLRGSFELGVVDGQVVAIAPVASGSAEFPDWFEWIGGITLFLVLAVSDAGRKASQAAWDRIDDLVAFLNIWLTTAPDRQIHSVRVYRDEHGSSVLTYRECPKA